MAKTATKKSKQKVCKAAESVAQVVQNTQLQVAHHFPCPIYLIERPDFLEVVNTVSEEALADAKKAQPLNEIYPVYMTGNYFGDPRMAGFSEFVGATAWNILNEQGYAMQDKAVQFTEMWTQEHHKHSAMDAHVHGFGSQIVGFYFLETPENGSHVVFHDPRAAKVQIDLPEQDMNMATPASKMINFTPKPGMMIFANSWLMHSFTRHAADLPIKFVHFNLTVISAPQQACDIPPAAEIV
jgi:uncharacterized protein (TIGR02466 family)